MSRTVIIGDLEDETFHEHFLPRAAQLGLLAAVGTASAGGFFHTMTWAQQQNQPVVASSAPVDSSRESKWGGPVVASESILQGVQPMPGAEQAVDLTSPYRAANTPVELGSAYRPAGVDSKSSGANQPASIGLREPTPTPKALPPVPAGAEDNSEAIELATEENTAEYAVTATPTEDISLTNAAKPAVELANKEEPVSSEPAAAEPVTEQPVTDEPAPQVAESEASEPETVSEAAPEEKSLIQAMLAGEQYKENQAGAPDIDRARRTRQCIGLLGIAKESQEKECTEQQCVPEPTAVVATQVPEKHEIVAEPAIVPEQAATPVSEEPAEAQVATTVRDDAVSPASLVVPAQWRNAEPRAIEVAQGPANPFLDDPGATVQGPAGHFEVIQEETKALEVRVRRSLLLRTPFDIYRTAVVDSSVCDVVQFTPREISIVGKATGSTNVTFWFEDGNHRPVTYIVRVIPDLEEKSRAEVQYHLLEDVINELFPDSKVRLVLVADKLIVKGQAKSAEDAANILAIIRGQSSTNVANGRNSITPVQGFATNVFNQDETGRGAQPRVQVVNMLQVPGIQQVALRVKIAQLNRSAARGIGVDAEARINFGGDDDNSLFIQSMLNMAAGNSPSVITQFDDSDISLGLRYLQQQGVIRLLSEPTLVTLSGRAATFVSGGEFAVPTIVGSAGVNAVTTDFRAFGVIVSFLPTVLDKDRIRLQVSPEFSQINEGLNSGGTFGLNVNAVNTTVEMREGQTLAVAGLLEDTMKTTKVGNVPYLERIFGTRDSSRNENELIILVTPELVQPMEPEEVPPLPGFDVTEPTNKEFYWHGKLEGHPTSGFRSTVWPELRQRYRAGGPAMTSGPFGHGQ